MFHIELFRPRFVCLVTATRTLYLFHKNLIMLPGPVLDIHLESLITKISGRHQNVRL